MAIDEAAPRPVLRAVSLDLTAHRIAVAIALIVGVIGLVVSVGADARWLAALGGTVWHSGAIPHGIPYATAPSGGWTNALVLAELVFRALTAAGGDHGLAVAQLAAVAGGLAILAADAHAGGAEDRSVAWLLACVTVGALAAFAIARVQMFSLVLFPALVAVLRRDARSPGRTVWLALPLLALWSNLHGAVLSGLAVLEAYLLLGRGRRDLPSTVAVALLAPAALLLTPAGVDTVGYLHGLLDNEAAARGEGLWAPLGAGPLDVPLVAAAALLGARFWRGRPALWELAVALGLAALTVQASRSGVWLLMFLLAPAARGGAVIRMPARRRPLPSLLPPAALVGAALTVLAVAHGGRAAGAAPATLTRAIALAAGRPILAEGPLAEQVALAGGRVWIGNPLDAFPHGDQRVYLDWIAGRPGGRAALRRSGPVVLVTRGSRAARLTVARGGRPAGGDLRTEILIVGLRGRPAPSRS